MPVKTKKRKTKAERGKTVKKAAAKAAAKKSRKGKKPAAKKTAKKPVAKKSPAKKAVNKQARGKPEKPGKKPATKKGVSKSPAEKTTWKISPEISQSVYKIDTWKKGDLKIEHLKVYRSGWVLVDQRPDLGGYNPDEGINIFEEFEFDEHQLYDGSEQTSLFPDELPAEERGRLLALSEEELADEGWTLESVTRFKGPLVVEQV